MKKITEKLPLIAIFGRTNVGKSTLFNRLTETKKALVSDIEGTTRDSNLEALEWRGKRFRLVDTGGILDIEMLTKSRKKLKADNTIEQEVQKQARDYLQQADLILFLCDVKAGLLAHDRDLAHFIQKNYPPEKLIFAVNKTDGPKDRAEVMDFIKLGLGEALPVSAATGSGTGDLLDVIVERLGHKQNVLPEKIIDNGQAPLRASIIGKPNVGKSSLLNSILGEKRVIVSPIAHTTREPQDTELIYKNQRITLIDTAGISRTASRTNKPDNKVRLEKLGIEKTLRNMNKVDIVLLVVDINEPLTHQDSKIVEEIFKRRKSLAIIANKWDLVKERDTKAYTESIYGSLPFATWAPIQFISAMTGEKTGKILDLILTMAEERARKITDKELQRFLKTIIKIHPPAKGKGFKHPYIYTIQQTDINPPSFEVKVRTKDDLHFSYLRFIENQLRKKYGFTGTPISMYVKKDRKKKDNKDNNDKSA
jgi:GTPase